MSEKLSKGLEMHSAASALENAREGVLELAGDGPLKTRVSRAHAYLKSVCTRRRIQAFLYNEPRQTQAHESGAIRAAVEQKRQRELETLRQQVAVLEAQYRDDRDAFEARTRELVGGFIPLLEKLGVVEARGTSSAEDGE